MLDRSRRRTGWFVVGLVFLVLTGCNPGLKYVRKGHVSDDKWVEVSPQPAAPAPAATTPASSAPSRDQQTPPRQPDAP